MMKSLSSVEFSDFGLFIRSPYFNYSKKILVFYDFLKHAYPDFKSEEIDRNKLFELLYPGEKYNHKKLRNQVELMVDLAEKHSAYLEFRRDTFENKFYLAKSLSRKNFNGLLDKKLDSLIGFLEKTKVKDENYYLKKYLVENLRNEYKESKTEAGRLKPVYEKLVMCDEKLVIYTLITLLINYLKLRSSEEIIKFERSYYLYESMHCYVKNELEYFKEIPAIKILNKFLEFIEKENPETGKYLELKELLFQNPDIFERGDESILYTILYNYCKHREERGEKEFGKESFEIMKIMRAKDLHLEKDGYLHQHNYINYAANAFRQNELEWAEEFINKDKDKLRPEFRWNAFNYNCACLNYIKGRRNKADRKMYYGTAIKLISKIKKEDFYYYTRIKNMEVKIYYELRKYTKCYDVIDSYRNSFERNDLIPENLRERYLNFIELTFKLLKLNDRLKNLSKEEIYKEKEALRNEIETCKEVDSRKWLLEKAEEM